MESIFFIICNSVFYTFFWYVLYSFSFLSNLNSALILLIFSLILSAPSLIMLYILKKDRKKYFIYSSISIVFISLLFFIFGENILNMFNIKSGLINYTIYLYKYLFMFSPILSLFFVSLHKTFAQKKQLFLIIALKYILPIVLGFVFMHFLEFYKLLWLFAITDLLTTISSLWISSRKF